MMASHRPSDPPPAEPAPPVVVQTGLQPSGFVTGFDWVLAFGVLVLAFFVGSFSVRNSDFWMHLAAGRQASAQTARAEAIEIFRTHAAREYSEVSAVLQTD